MSTATEELLSIIPNNSRISFLTGAGVSTDSGIPDFKSVDNNWSYSVPRTVALSNQFLRRNPDTFWNIFSQTFISKIHAKPNPFHHWVKSLEETHDVCIATQNIDGLHSVAGSEQVFEMHGNIREAYCQNRTCKKPYSLVGMGVVTSAPQCNACGAFIRPNVTLFGEQLPAEANYAVQHIMESDVLVVAGTALDVSPVNTIPLHFSDRYPQKKMVWINKEKAPKSVLNNFYSRSEQYHFTDKFVMTFEEFLGA